MNTAYPPVLNEMIAAYHARTPPRTWSLIVTIFGDVAMARGGSLWLGDLSEWLGGVRIDAGLVRTALSRLVSADTLLRERLGKNAFYRLSAAARSEFLAAADVIYGRDVPKPTGRLHLALIDACLDKTSARTHFLETGYAALTSTLLVHPAHNQWARSSYPDALVFDADADPAFAGRSEEIWPLRQIATSYDTVIKHAEALLAAPDLSAHSAFMARLLLVHAFRRVVLRDPYLPEALLPSNWPGQHARSRFDAAYARLHALSEPWIAENITQ